MGEFLLPLFELHASMSAARRTARVGADVTALAKFDRRIDLRNIRLSRREYQTCKCLLDGHTVPEVATALELRLSTAESYVKRAFEKLGVRTKWELLQWAHSAD